jgi:hypothetical protein
MSVSPGYLIILIVETQLPTSRYFVIGSQSFQCDQASEPPRQTTQQDRNRATLDR